MRISVQETYKKMKAWSKTNELKWNRKKNNIISFTQPSNKESFSIWDPGEEGVAIAEESFKSTLNTHCSFCTTIHSHIKYAVLNLGS